MKSIIYTIKFVVPAGDVLMRADNPIQEALDSLQGSGAAAVVGIEFSEEQAHKLGEEFSRAERDLDKALSYGEDDD